jgi:hypothetical protein
VQAMEMVDYVYEALKDLPCPVLHLTRPKKLPGITYHFFNQRPYLHGDGAPVREECQCQVDIWTENGKDAELSKAVRKAMKKAGFKRVRMNDDFERETGIYHKVIIFYIEYETEDY